MHALLLALLVAVPVANPPPRGAVALKKAAVQLCNNEDGSDDYSPDDVLSGAGVKAVAPLMTAMSSPAGCDDLAAPTLVAEILCLAQASVRGKGLTPAFAPVRAALESADRRRVAAGLAAVGEMGAWLEEDSKLMESGGDGPPMRVKVSPPERRCPAAERLLAGAAVPLGRLLARSTGARRLELLRFIEGLDLKESGAPLVPALVRVLDDDTLRSRTARLLGTLGKGAASAAGRLGQLLAQSRDPAAESTYASALVSIGAPAPGAIPSMRARLTEAAAEICAPATPTRFLTLFRAARAIGPAPAKAQASWRADLLSRARTALTNLAPPCNRPEIERDIILEVAKMPSVPEVDAELEAVMTNESRLRDGRHWAALALRTRGAPLSSRLTALADTLVSPSDPSPFVLPSSGPGPLSRSAFVLGIRAVRQKVLDCYARYQVPGLAMLDVVIEPDGTVSQAMPSGKFAGTPTGACVENAVKTARFPPSDGFRTPYPFQLK